MKKKTEIYSMGFEKGYFRSENIVNIYIVNIKTSLNILFEIWNKMQAVPCFQDSYSDTSI